MSQSIKSKQAEANEAYIAPANPAQEENTYNWSSEDLKRAVEILNSAPKSLTPMALSAKEAHERLFGISQ